jgi:hypothetical protein
VKEVEMNKVGLILVMVLLVACVCVEVFYLPKNNDLDNLFVKVFISLWFVITCILVFTYFIPYIPGWW